MCPAARQADKGPKTVNGHILSLSSAFTQHSFQLQIVTFLQELTPTSRHDKLTVIISFWHQAVNTVQCSDWLRHDLCVWRWAMRFQRPCRREFTMSRCTQPEIYISGRISMKKHWLKNFSVYTTLGWMCILQKIRAVTYETIFLKIKSVKNLFKPDKHAGTPTLTHSSKQPMQDLQASQEKGERKKETKKNG